jgi:phenylalanyl-tRNA synthetase beta chain
VVRDLSVTVPADAPMGVALELAREAAGALLEEIVDRDEYRGEQLGARKSWTFRLTFRAPDRTLTGAEAQAAYDAVVTALEARLDAEVRR